MLFDGIRIDCQTKLEGLADDGAIVLPLRAVPLDS